MFTVKQAQQYYTKQLSSLSDTAPMDVDILLCHCLDKTRVWLMTWPDTALTTLQQQTLAGYMERRCAGEPIAYIVGEQEFWSLPLKVSSDTLIPRPETELIVELALARCKAGRMRVLDLGTGTGAIPLALKSERPLWDISAVDLSSPAIAIAKENAQTLSLDVDFHVSDWFSNVKGAPFELITSNPPYIDKSDEHLSQGDVRFEPDSALISDEQGYGDIRRICKASEEYLAIGGILMFEHGYAQGRGVRAIMAEYGLVDVETVQDLAGLDRVTLGIRQ